jgi:phosphoribosyl-ATP pyrophosphohydrolase
MLKMMNLDKNKSLKLDHSIWTWNEILNKAKEEAKELTEAIKDGDKAHIAEEVLDNIQINIGILDKLHQEGINVNQEFLRHEKKLINRGWKSKGVIEIEVKSIGRL